MVFKIQVIIDNEHGETKVEDIVRLEKNSNQGYCIGLSLLESKQILKELQQKIILYQAENYTKSHRAYPCCQKQRRVKGYHTIQYRTLFGTILMPSLRLYECVCRGLPVKTFSIYGNIKKLGAIWMIWCKLANDLFSGI